MGKNMIEFTRPDGKKAPGYLALPATGAETAKGVVVVEEWWGLNDQIKRTADRLAEAGYRALVPDLFRGKIAKSGDEGSHMMSQLDWGDAAQQDIRGAVQYLKTDSPSKVAVLGFCTGGALTIIAGVHLPEVDAGVCCYGIPPAAAADPSKLRVPMQFHFALHDDWCSPASVDKLEQAMKHGNVSYDLYRYDAHHAFMNDARPEVFQAKATSLVWERALAFLRTELGRETSES